MVVHNWTPGIKVSRWFEIFRLVLFLIKIFVMKRIEVICEQSTIVCQDLTAMKRDAARITAS